MLSSAIVFDLGTGPAVARATASSLVADDGRRIASIVRAGVAIQAVLGLGAALLIAVGAPLLLDVLRVPAGLQADAHLAMLALAIAMPLVLMTQSLQGVLEGLERFNLIAA